MVTGNNHNSNHKLEDQIKSIPYTISGSQCIGWLIQYEDGREIDIPNSVNWQTVKQIAEKNS